MKRSILRFSLLAGLVCGTVAAGQEPVADQNESTPIQATNVQPSAPTLTPEIWLYLQQQKRNDDPRVAVRHNAELRAAQRRARIATMKWYGLSSQRPVVSPVPFMSTHATYRFGTPAIPYRWPANARPLIATQPANPTVRR